MAGLAATVLAIPLSAQDVDLDGALLLFHHRPVGEDAPPPRTEVYAAIASATLTQGRWQLHGQVRARDRPLRSYYPGNIWIQRAWVAFDALPGEDAPLATLRAGKIDPDIGRVWDGTFMGNVHYYDGLKRNPEFGVETAGTLPVGSLGARYTLQYMLDSDRVSGALPGRDFATLDGYRNRNSVFGRLDVGGGGLTVGTSLALLGVAERAGTTETVFRVPHAGAQVELARSGLTAYGEWLHRGRGDLPDRLREMLPGSAATYWLAGAQLRRGAVQGRYNISRGRYHDLGRTDEIHVVGGGIDISAHLHVIGELIFWNVSPAGDPIPVPRSVNVVLHLRL